MHSRITPQDDRVFRGATERERLRDVYLRVDALVADVTCERSTDCCHFERTGREPYVTPIEYAEARLAAKASGFQASVRGSQRGRALPMADEGRCPYLGSEGHCRIYASRPLGCRTFFCERATGAAPRREVAALLREIVDLSEKLFVEGSKSRPLRSWVASG